MPEVTQFYLTSMWGYTPAGAETVTQALQDCGLESSEFTYEHKFRWFNAVCLDKDAPLVLQRFSAINAELEASLNYDKLVDQDATPRDETGNLWLEDPRDDFWTGNQENLATKALKASLPPDFHKFNAKSVWHCDEESTRLDGVLTFPVRDKLQKACGVELSWDLTMGVVYIGGDTEDAIKMVRRKLDTLLASSRESPRPQHVFYPEDSDVYLIDVRYAGLINPGIVTSTIFDPAEFRISKQYPKLREQSVALRAGVPSEDDSYFVSLFGPRAPALFPEKDKRSPFTPFAKHDYAPKSAALQNPVANWIDRVQDADTPTPRSLPLPYGETPTSKAANFLGDATGPLNDLHLSERVELEARKADIEQKLAMLEAKEADAGQVGGSKAALSEDPVALLSRMEAQYMRAGILPSSGPVDGAKPGLVGDDATMSIAASSSEQMFSAWQGVFEPGNAHAHPASYLRHVPIPGKPRNGPGPGTSPNEERPSHVYHETMRQQAPSRALGEARQGDKITGVDFQHDIETALAHLVGHARTKVGGLSLRLEFGRILMTKMPSSAIAHNAPGQRSNGWEPKKLANLLNQLPNSKSVYFTKILSLYTPDAEYLVSIRDKDTRKGLWNPHVLKVIYEFRCRRLLPNGVRKDFIIEVDGSKGTGFKYHIRNGPGDIEPVWIHCLHRHWDCRVVLLHADSVTHQTECGRFAELLTSSLTIPSTTPEDLKLLWLEDVRDQITVVRLRIRNVARYLSADRQSHLDVTQVRDVHVQLIQEPRVRKRLADVKVRAAPREGVFGTWFEASITSVEGERLLLENAGMTLGDQASWTLETFKAAKVFESLYGPAVKMIQRMDGVGVHCDNGTFNDGAPDGEDADPGGDGDAASLAESSVMGNSVYRAKERRHRLEGADRW